MKTKELVEELEYSELYEGGQAHYIYLEPMVRDEIIKRLKEFEELKGIIKNPHLTHDYTMEELIEKMRTV